MGSEITSEQPKPVPSWAAHLPPPQSKPALIEATQLAELILKKKAGVDFLVVDVRRQDFEDCFVRTAVNIPAQSFHQTLPTLFALLQRIPEVIFYCGSSNGRGPRCAGWYQDALDGAGITTSQAKILMGGIKGWIAQFAEDDGLVTKI